MYHRVYLPSMPPYYRIYRVYIPIMPPYYRGIPTRVPEKCITGYPTRVPERCITVVEWCPFLPRKRGNPAGKRALLSSGKREKPLRIDLSFSLRLLKTGLYPRVPSTRVYIPGSLLELSCAQVLSVAGLRAGYGPASLSG